MVRRLVERYFVIERPDPRDARVKLPTLHEDGRILLDTVAETFLLIALAELAPEDRRVLLAGTAAARHPARVVLRVGPIAGALGRIVEMHARYYAGVAGFGSPFERAVAIELADFLGRVERPTNRLWLAVRGDRIVGSIAIDGEDLGPGTAHLRWFILEEGERGGGVGSRLLSAALAFCDEIGFGETRLWTFEGLRAARRLYEKSGFRLVEEKTGDRWGAPVVEQSFSRAMAPGRPLM